jgi:hypothetical protein
LETAERRRFTYVWRALSDDFFFFLRGEEETRFVREQTLECRDF